MDLSQTPATSTLPNSSGHRRIRRLLLAALKFTVMFAVIPIATGAIVITMLANNARVHAYLIRELQSRATTSLGVPITLQNFALHLSTLSVDLYGITISGASPYPNPPLLQVPHVEVGIGIISILHGRWYLSRFRLDRPVVQVFVDSQGISNIPTLRRRSRGTSDNTVFDLGVRHAVLDHGEFFYNNRPSELAFDVHDLGLDTSFNPLLDRYSGTLAYTDGSITYGVIHPPTHSVGLSFDATPSTFHLSAAKIVSGNSQVTVNGTVSNFANPKIHAQIEAALDGSRLAGILHNPSIPSGLISTKATLQYQQRPQTSVMDTLQLEGDVSSPHLKMKTAAAQLEIGNLTGHYFLANGEAVLRDFHANLLGGEVKAQGTMKNIVGNSQSHMEATIHRVSLAELRQAVSGTRGASGLAVAGAIDATAIASWGKTLDDLIAHADATIVGHVAETQQHARRASGTSLASTTNQPADGSSIPVRGMLHATYHAQGQRLSVENSYLRTAGASLTMNGVISKDSSLLLQLQANDLREEDAIAEIFRTPSSNGTIQPLGLGGTASFHALVKGSVTSPHLTGQLAVQNLHLNGTTWRLIRTSVDASPSLVSFQDVDLEAVSHGKITGNASIGLTKWAYSSSSPLQIQMDASRMEVADLLKLTGQNIPVTGLMHANLAIHGSVQNPTGTGTISFADLVAYGEPISSVSATFSGTKEEARVEMSVHAPAGSLSGKATLRAKERSYQAEVTSSAIQLDKLQFLRVKSSGASGVVSLKATGQGSFDSPQMDATLQIPNLIVQGQAIKDVNLKTTLANRLATLDLTSNAFNTSIRAHATVSLIGDYPADASIDTQGVPLAPFFAIFAPRAGSSVSGQTELHAILRGPLKDRPRLEGHAVLPVLKLAYGDGIQLAATAPIHIDYKNGVIDVQRAEIKGTGTDIQIQGSIPTVGNAPITLSLNGTTNMQLAQLFDPDLRSSGEMKFNINANGTTAGLNLAGTIDVVDVSLASADAPTGIQHLNGSLLLSSDRINITKLQGTLGGGSLAAQGGIALRPNVQFQIGVATQGVRLLYPHGVRESLDANLQFTGTTDAAQLGGSVNVTDLSFGRDFELSTLIAQLSSGVEAPPSRGFSHNVALNLAVRSTSNLNLVSRALSLAGSANLQVRGTLDEPVILGRANLTGGDIMLNGNRFLLSGGTVQFINPSKTDPVVNLTLSTSIQQYNIDLRLTGPLEQLHPQYSSDPALPSADIINLLAFGQTTNANQTTPATQAAESLVASQVSSQVTSRFSKIAGISQLSINPVLASSNSQGPPGANVTIQQRVTGNLFITFSTNVASTQSQTIQGQYRLSPRVSVSATRDPNGGVAVDTIIKKSW